LLGIVFVILVFSSTGDLAGSHDLFEYLFIHVTVAIARYNDIPILALLLAYFTSGSHYFF
jgi:hypothetical protein